MDFANLNLDDNQEIARNVIMAASKKTFARRGDFEHFRNGIIKEFKGKVFHNLYFIKAYYDLLKEKKIKNNPALLSLLRKRGVRTLSGVTPVTVLTKPYPCPGKCIYCPTDIRMPKSYLQSQPAAQRAFSQDFDPYTQVFVRLKALTMTGHEVSKVELRVIGGTFSFYPKAYQTWFVKRCLLAMNDFPLLVLGKKPFKKNLSFAYVVKINETAEVRCIGVNIETRPDYINKAEVKRLRMLGVTKVEMGVQTTDEKIQKLTKRGHDLKAVKDATGLLKDSGFKIGYHMMPNLPGSTPDFDKKMVGELFTDSGFQPDYLKIYPCVVVPKAQLFYIFKRGEYQPYDDATLEEVLLVEMLSVPEWCRVDRVARDIPSDEITAGSKVSNIRQILEQKLMKRTGKTFREIRAREIKNETFKNKDVKLVVREYDANGGEEFFISFEDPKQDKIIALLRLRFAHKTFIPELKNASLVREIHVYGKQVAVGKRSGKEKQHGGLGSKLMKYAEDFSKKNGYKKIAVIAGIGTREYYKKLGYRIKGTYMLKGI
ncbi:tRNA uridine(34) 5-carboxymethylaminomethyl modification radical SAM/GNAT enzyme Elp3 [Candidatus Peregrinibacteria bacterium CG_4_9_14_0_2_um_filter_38_9]|nr:MAG: tRNA uridine(34) 5-carboxymethylaminomethyl modification radical SAM/GNAT enzyme Elp3 [Candidatus Peregrinibacteria bacterium CG_4_9_14_0_2_um_filter_38_9]